MKRTPIVSYCDTYNLPYFIDDTFNYAIQNPEQIPFLSNVDPLNKARILPVHELNEPIKVVIPLVEHEDIREDLIFNLNKLECLDLSYHDIERCLYINPKGVSKASTAVGSGAVEAQVGVFDRQRPFQTESRNGRGTANELAAPTIPEKQEGKE